MTIVKELLSKESLSESKGVRISAIYRIEGIAWNTVAPLSLMKAAQAVHRYQNAHKDRRLRVHDIGASSREI